MLVRGEVAERELPRARHLRRVADLGGDLRRHLVTDTRLVEVPQVPDQRHRAHGRDHGLPGRLVHRALQPAGQRLPGHARRPPAARAPSRPGHDLAPLGGPQRHQVAVGGEHGQRLGHHGRVRVVPPVQRVLEQLALPRLAGVRRRVHQVEDVAEAVPLGRGVVLQQRLAVVETSYGVGDAPLDGLGHVAAVPGGPVGEQLAGLVRAPQHGGDDLAVRAGTVGGARVEARLHVLGGAHDRGRTQVALAAQPAEQAGRPRRVGDGELAHERGEPVVAVRAGLVEGALRNEVGHGEQKELGARVALLTSAALIGTEHAPGRGHARSGLSLRGLGVESRHGEFPPNSLVYRREAQQMECARGRSRRRTLILMLYPLSYTDPRSMTGFEPAEPPDQSRSNRCLRTGHTP